MNCNEEKRRKVIRRFKNRYLTTCWSSWKIKKLMRNSKNEMKEKRKVNKMNKDC